MNISIEPKNTKDHLPAMFFFVFWSTLDHKKCTNSVLVVLPTDILRLSVICH